MSIIAMRAMTVVIVAIEIRVTIGIIAMTLAPVTTLIIITTSTTLSLVAMTIRIISIA